MNSQPVKDIFWSKPVSEPDRLIADVLHAESTQWAFEAGHAIESAEPSLALNCLRKAADAALLYMPITPYTARAWLLDFAWFVALCGDTRFADDLKTLAGFNAGKGRPIAGPGDTGECVRARQFLS